MPTKIHLLIALSLVGLLGGCLVAYAHEGENHGIPEVTYEELGATKPSLLPSHTFYFLKEWRRAFVLLFTFDSVKKAAREAEFTNEKAAEVKALAEENLEHTDAFTRAIQNYRTARARAEKRLQSLAQNPHAAELLIKTEERAKAHEALFEELQGR